MITIYVDGATSVRSRLSGAGIYIRDRDQFHSYKIPLGKLTNQEAEFYATIHALGIANQYYPNRMISLRTDSQHVVDAYEKKYVKNERYQPLLAEIIERSLVHPQLFMKWIPSKENRVADQLAKQAIAFNQ